ncbi:hypothetical protein Tsubulata_613111 [Turnera subulata]|uniref:Receptor-like serine/threonine-protein kinase n=1 Tax=Turnera subulata TaxID=218843 RepID=A0A9Q0J4X7_9ROSI|nr:hypothetical protein Tsubulata_613111 [Turnera subulata]
MNVITKAFLVSILKLLLLQICVSKDTVSVNEPLADGETLVSRGEKFTLGFFSPGNSSKRYVGIWYTSVTLQTVVWVANREHPINDKSGVLSVNDQGNLVLFPKNYSSTTPVWSTNVTTTSSTSNSIARLLDSGNLVLIREDGRSVAWQSFDHPVNTLLPNAKLGIDRRTGLNRVLTSWKSLDDPGRGNWSRTVENEATPETYLYKGRVRWWRSGPWDGYKWNGVPETGRKFIFNATVISNNDETVFMWNTTDSSVIARIYLDESGMVSRSLWHAQDKRWIIFYSAPTEECDYYGHCGPFGMCDPYKAGVFECSCLPGFQPKKSSDWYLRDGTGGCVRNPGVLTCSNGEGFVKIANAKVPDTSLAKVSLGLDLKACQLECLRNCSCMAYSIANVKTGTGCIAWFEDLIDSRVFTYGGQDLYVRVDAAELAKYNNSSKNFLAKRGMLAVVLISIAVPSIIGLCILCCWIRSKQIGRQQVPKLPDNYSIALLPFGDGSKDEFDEGLLSLDVDAIIAATGNFSFANKLGEGGFGSVYKGQLGSGQDIAVKRLSATSRQGVEEFKNEVRLISKLQHKNLVRLYGCCIHGEEKMLIYEFLPNRSLDFFIFDKARRCLLDWGTRFEIIMGIARGLLYLHQDSRLKIIHRDLKAGNVLLDAAMNPKISDFGMAKIFGDDQTEANTNRVIGTYGYMSPEYAMDGLYSLKSDVFSYGVLILEIISGRRNSYYLDEDPSKNLIGLVWELWREGTALDIVDSSLGEAYPAREVLKCIQVGLLCVQENPTDRPTMSAIVFMLGNETALSSPNKPAFILKTRQTSTSSSSTSKIASSINDVSITRIEPR